MIKKIKFITTVPKLKIKERLDKIISILFNQYSRSKIKQWILDNNVKINEKIINEPKKKVSGGEIISILKNIEIISPLEPQNIFLNIIYEDNYIIVINKPCNQVVHPGAGNLNGTILNALLYHYPKNSKLPRAGIIHRLDKNTTGLMIIAKTVLTYNKLITAMKSRNIIRNYEAIVIGKISSKGTINQPISRHPIKRTSMMVHPKGKLAITHYNIIENFPNHTHLYIQLDTGRTHQIRVHMSYIKHPLVGDPIYNNQKYILKNTSKTLIKTLHNFNRQALHATKLTLIHPINNIKMTWTIPKPHDMINLINLLKSNKKNKI
ncbi:Ribosomal large subunit pseudouridine synthase D [Serratia symbiotica]|nr:Ribosomal large subunit pseudouridine synthase D [Serratia symbiotica]